MHIGGGGKSSCTLSKMLVLASVLATVPVHETSLVNQHFYSAGRRGYAKLLSVRL